MAIVVPSASTSVNDIICSAAASLGYSKLKPTQQEVVEKIVSGRDVFVCLPTGSGKSLCYAHHVMPDGAPGSLRRSSPVDRQVSM